MNTFRPGDRVVAINTDHSGPICGPINPKTHPFLFPDGLLRQGPIYHVAIVSPSRNDGQSLWITGLRVLWGNKEFPWHSTRFRKIDPLKDFAKTSRRRRLVAAVCNRQAHSLTRNSPNLLETASPATHSRASWKANPQAKSF